MISECCSTTTLIAYGSSAAESLRFDMVLHVRSAVVRK